MIPSWKLKRLAIFFKIHIYEICINLIRRIIYIKDVDKVNTKKDIDKV
jgi:hypothetical protein